MRARERLYRPLPPSTVFYRPLPSPRIPDRRGNLAPLLGREHGARLCERVLDLRAPLLQMRPQPPEHHAGLGVRPRTLEHRVQRVPHDLHGRVERVGYPLESRHLVGSETYRVLQPDDDAHGIRHRRLEARGEVLCAGPPPLPAPEATSAPARTLTPKSPSPSPPPEATEAAGQS